MATFDYDVVIVGSGFGGSVAALRAAEKGYRVGVMESGRRWNDADIPRTQWDLPHFLWLPGSGAVRDPADRVPRRRPDPLGRGGRWRLPRVCQHAVRAAEAVLRRAGVGGHHRLGRRAGAVHRPGEEDARRRPLPVHADRRGSSPAPGRARHRARRDVQQGARRRLLRNPWCRGRRSVLRRRRTAAHRMHLVRQLQHRLRPQRQEQADDELPLPGGEARRRRSTSCTRSTTSARSKAAASRSTRVIPDGHSEQRTCTSTPTPPSRSSSPPTRTDRRSSSITCSTRAG